jgi:hypothetical protein
MKSSKPETDVVASGSAGDVVYAQNAAGEFPAHDFLEELRETEPANYAGLMHLFKLFADQWRIANHEHFKKLENSKPTLFEFKKYQTRLPCFMCKSSSGRKRIALTHGFKKKTDKIPDAEKNRAYRIRVEHFDSTDDTQ